MATPRPCKPLAPGSRDAHNRKHGKGTKQSWKQPSFFGSTTGARISLLDHDQATRVGSHLKHLREGFAIPPRESWGRPLALPAGVMGAFKASGQTKHRPIPQQTEDSRWGRARPLLKKIARPRLQQQTIFAPVPRPRDVLPPEPPDASPRRAPMQTPPSPLPKPRRPNLPDAAPRPPDSASPSADAPRPSDVATRRSAQFPDTAAGRGPPTRHQPTQQPGPRPHAPVRRPPRPGGHARRTERQRAPIWLRMDDSYCSSRLPWQSGFLQAERPIYLA